MSADARTHAHVTRRQPVAPDASPQGGVSEVAALAQLASLDDMGPARLRALLANHGALDALRALSRCAGPPVEAVLGCRGVDRAVVARWAAMLRDGADDLDDLERRHAEAGIRIEAPADLRDNPLWRDDPDPPAMLFWRGEPIPYEGRRVSIVGTRNCSAYGRTMATRIARGLADAGVTVISGLATGIDATAQQAALDAGGPVVAVVATGLDVVYPERNRPLADGIARRGTLVSEYPLGTQPQRWRFPARNRLIAALAEVVIVVESKATGGSLYTVEAAIERDRTVMAVPGPATVRTFDGTNQLLVDGCPPVRHADDVLDVLGLTSPPSMSGTDGSGGTGGSADADPEAALTDNAQRLLAEMVGAARSVDELVVATGLELGVVIAQLHDLAATGWVTENTGWWERKQ